MLTELLTMAAVALVLGGFTMALCWLLLRSAAPGDAAALQAAESWEKAAEGWERADKAWASARDAWQDTLDTLDTMEGRKQ